VSTIPTALSVAEWVAIRREFTRTALAVLVISLVGALSLIIVVWVLADRGDAKTVITGIFTPVIGIAGTILGFYFGSNDDETV
jgi:mannose/fructose/N-acetylgalactosamine-specific phosphotransferase system component IID